MPKDQPDIGIVAPVFNEAEGISAVIDTWVCVLQEGIDKSIWNSYEIVFCDDGSFDDTARIIEKKIIKNSRIRLIRNPTNQGAGISLANAIENTKSKHIVLMDSDGQFDPQEIIEMYEQLGKFDAVCGVRSKSSNFSHRLASQLSTKYANVLFKTNVEDFNCQFKLLPGHFMRSQKLRATRMNYSGEITYLVASSNLSVLWREINHAERTTGKSKTRLLNDGIARLLFLTYLGFEQILASKKIIRINKTKD